MVWMAPHAPVPRRKDDHSIHCPFLDESDGPQWTATHNDWHVSCYVTSLHTLNQLRFLDEQQTSLHWVLILFHVSEGTVLYHKPECIPQSHRRPPYVTACMPPSQVWNPFIIFRSKYVVLKKMSHPASQPASRVDNDNSGNAKVGSIVNLKGAIPLCIINIYYN